MMTKLLSKGSVGAGGFNHYPAGVEQRVTRVHVQAADLADNSEVDTGVDLPDNALITSVWLEVVTAEATATTKTLDVGLLSGESGGDADGFMVGADVSAAGIVLPGITETAGGSESYISASTYGALIADQELGSDLATDHGYIHVHPHVINGNAESVSVTAGDAGGFTEFDGYLYFVSLVMTAPGA